MKNEQEYTILNCITEAFCLAGILFIFVCSFVLIGGIRQAKNIFSRSSSQ